MLGLLAAAAVVLGGLFMADRLASNTETKASDAPSGNQIHKSDAEWQKVLTAEQFHVTRRKGTERAFTGADWNRKDDGVYHCVCCGQSLFDSRTKFDSGTGWPSFYQPIEAGNVAEITDNSWMMQRTEVTCGRCDAHLGHVFTDGPKPTGLRTA